MVTLDSYANANRDNGVTFIAAYPANSGAFYQSFKTPNDGTTNKLTTATVMLKKDAAWVGTVQAEVYSHTGTYGTSSAPSALLATSDVLSESSVTTSYADVSFAFTAANQIILAANTSYVLVIKCVSHNGQAYGLSIGVDTSAPTHAGNAGLWTSA